MQYNRKYSDVVSQKQDWIMNKNKIKNIIKKELKADSSHKILEIGCNKGDFVKYFKQFYPDSCGIDINKDAINDGCVDSLFVMDSTKMIFPDKHFDRIYSSHVIEHINDSNALFKEIERVLKPEGFVVLVYPFEIIRGMASIRTSWQTYRSLKKARDLHVHLYTPKKIKKIIRSTKLQHIDSKLFFGNSPQWVTILSKK